MTTVLNRVTGERAWDVVQSVKKEVTNNPNAVANVVVGAFVFMTTSSYIASYGLSNKMVSLLMEAVPDIAIHMGTAAINFSRPTKLNHTTGVVMNTGRLFQLAYNIFNGGAFPLPIDIGDVGIHLWNLRDQIDRLRKVSNGDTAQETEVKKKN